MKTRQFNPIPIKILMPSFHKKIEENLNFLWKCKRPKIIKTILNRMNYAGGIIIHDAES